MNSLLISCDIRYMNIQKGQLSADVDEQVVAIKRKDLFSSLPFPCSLQQKRCSCSHRICHRLHPLLLQHGYRRKRLSPWQRTCWLPLRHRMWPR